jgi:beta-phosphoglucomutase-like phosphatase (HAD superfamily)
LAEVGGGSPFGAAIFDMDGLLVDSEPLWHAAEVEVLGGLGVPIAAGDPRRTKGIFVREVTRYWHDRHPWKGPTPDEVATRIVDRVIDLVGESGVLQPGVDEAISLCRRHGLPLAVASSSEHRLITFVLERFALAGQFTFAHSAEEEPYGKPHPAVFLTTAQRLGVAADRCLVWEDAPAGVLAAKAARMTCVAVPAPDERGNPAFAIADVVLSSLEEADDSLWDRLVAARWEVEDVGGREPAGPR